MQAVVDGIRKNPDVWALLVLCVTLGLGRMPETTTALGIHQLWQPSAQSIVQTVAAHLPLFEL